MLIPRTTTNQWYLSQRDNSLSLRDLDTPPSPFSFSYFVPLLLVVLACGGFVFYRRSRRRGEIGIPLSFPASQQSGIRLSEDGPPTHTFTHDNASSDSLPSHALEDLPDLNKLQRPPLSTIYSSSSSTSSSVPDYNGTALPSTGLSKAGFARDTITDRAPMGSRSGSGSHSADRGRGGLGGLSVGGRRSMKARHGFSQGQTAIEPSDSEDEHEPRGQNGDPFGIGDDDEGEEDEDEADDHERGNDRYSDGNGGSEGDLGPLGRTL
ncbi:hypothetical protein IAU59_002321 [Kwoniella sp. CBS 9459]